MGSALEPDTVGGETVAAADYRRRFNRRIRLSVSTHFQKHGLYSKVASLDWKSSAGLIRPPLDRPLFPFSPTNTLFSPLPSSLSFISLHLSHSLLSFSLPLPVTPAVSLSYPSPICGKLRLCACRRWVNLWRQCTHAHTHISCLPRRHLFQSDSGRCSTSRREGKRNRTRKAGRRDKKREREREFYRVKRKDKRVWREPGRERMLLLLNISMWLLRSFSPDLTDTQHLRVW